MDDLSMIGRMKAQISLLRYFVASSGNAIDDMIIKYIEDQGKEPPDNNFMVDDELL
jgi:hypothetical protein